MAGEDAQDTGRTGLQRAKQWLELTTRVKESYTHRDRQFAELLHFQWPYGSKTSFSFDLGGRFQGDHLDNKSFLAEIKNYRYESDLPVHFRDFLAKCYVALDAKPNRCDNFLWISWSPFQAKAWNKHTTVENVRNCIIHEANRKRVLDVDNEPDAVAKLDTALTAGVADRVWMITLSDQLEQLVLTEGHFYQMVKLIAQERGLTS